MVTQMAIGNKHQPMNWAKTRAPNSPNNLEMDPPHEAMNLIMRTTAPEKSVSQNM